MTYVRALAEVIAGFSREQLAGMLNESGSYWMNARRRMAKLEIQRRYGRILLAHEVNLGAGQGMILTQNRRSVALDRAFNDAGYRSLCGDCSRMLPV